MAYEDKAVITCALSGVLANRDQCPAIPYTPVEIAEEGRRRRGHLRHDVGQSRR